MTDKTIRVATDVGGTFTDLVCCEVDNDTGQLTIRTEKSDTTPPDFEPVSYTHLTLPTNREV